MEQKALILLLLVTSLGIAYASYYDRFANHGAGIVTIESNLGNYRVIPADKGGIDNICLELDLDICKGEF